MDRSPGHARDNRRTVDRVIGRHAAFVRDRTMIGEAPLVPEIALHLATEVTPLWQATEADLAIQGLPPPFWAFAWPGGQALARLLLDRPELVRGRTVLDFAAGCGIAAIAAGMSGAAKVTASEIDVFAAAAIRLNAERNEVAIEVVLEDILARPAEPYEIILAGDVCYERPMAERVLGWLGRAIAAGAEVLVADPGRAYLPSAGLARIADYNVPTSLDLESRALMTTPVYRLETVEIPRGPDAAADAR